MVEFEEKKEHIATTFMKFFQKYGMRKTIVNDIAKELKMSKKTIYKYFGGGKEEALYFFFNRIAEQYVNEIRKKISEIRLNRKKIDLIIRQIFQQGRPFVRNNVADREDYLIENEIVGRAFKEAYQGLIKEIIDEGIKSNEFEPVNSELIIHFIYGIILETMTLIHDNPDIKPEEDVIKAIFKLLN